MAVVFDGPNKMIIVQLGTDVLNIQDMYSRWVDWVLTEEGSRYLFALRYSGGEPTVPGQSSTPYFYLLNGWKIDACCEFEGLNHELTVEGIILCEDFSSPFYMDPSMPMTMLRSIVPIRTETVSTSGASFDVPDIVAGVWDEPVKTGMTAKQAVVEISDFVEDPPVASVDVPAIVDGLLNTDDSIEPGYNVGQTLRLVLSVLVATSSTLVEGSTATKTFRDINDLKDRLIGVISDIERTSEVLDKD
jgi:hypothetical protein